MAAMAAAAHPRWKMRVHVAGNRASLGQHSCKVWAQLSCLSNSTGHV